MEFPVDLQQLNNFVVYGECCSQYGDLVTVGVNSSYLIFQVLHKSNCGILSKTFVNLNQKFGNFKKHLFEVRSNLLKKFTKVLKALLTRFSVKSGTLVFKPEGWLEVYIHTPVISTHISLHMEDHVTERHLDTVSVNEPYATWTISGMWLRKICHQLYWNCKWIRLVLNDERGVVTFKGYSSSGEEKCEYKCFDNSIEDFTRQQVIVEVSNFLDVLKLVPSSDNVAIRIKTNQPLEVRFNRMICYLAPTVENEKNNK